MLTNILKEKLDHDKNFVQEFNISQGKETGPALNVYLKMAEGKNVTGAEIDEIIKGNVKIDMDVQKGDNVTGAKVKRIRE